ncbi:hypothetical protein ACX0G7_03255 [Flavitalea antarctica]
MKFLKITMLSCAFVLMLASCSKKSSDDSTPVSNSIEGAWSGSSVTESTNTKSFYSFDIRPNGVLNRLDETGAVVGTGIWSMNNNIFEGTYKNANTAKFSVIGSYNKTVAKILGNWGYGNSVTNGGTWEMTRKK